MPMVQPSCVYVVTLCARGDGCRVGEAADWLWEWGPTWYALYFARPRYSIESVTYYLAALRLGLQLVSSQAPRTRSDRARCRGCACGLDRLRGRRASGPSEGSRQAAPRNNRRGGHSCRRSQNG